MPLLIIKDDITKVKTEAIVNAANKSLLGGGGVDGAIHSAAGPELLEECRGLKGCNTGEAKITKGYKLPAKYVIHTVGPIYIDGSHGEEDLLRSCYKNSLKLAQEKKIESIAFPLISAGVYGYPKDEAIKIAKEEILRFLSAYDMIVYLVIFDRKSFKISKELFNKVNEYINDNYIDELEKGRTFGKREGSRRHIYVKDVSYDSSYTMEYAEEKPKGKSLEQFLNNQGETFSEMLLRLIDERDLKDSDVYKRANIDRKLFSKIRNNKNYKSSRNTVLSFAIALKLNMDLTQDLMLSAGYALSNSSKFDLIVRYFIENEIYDIFEINDVLFSFGENLLGQAI